MKSSHCCLVATSNRLHSTDPCQTFTSPSGQMCVPAKTDSSNPVSQPPTSGLSPSVFPSLYLFPLSVVLSFLLHLSLLANRSKCYPPGRSSGGWRGAALDPSPDVDATIKSSSIPQWTFLACCASLWANEMCHNQLSQKLPQGAFPSQHAFPLAG